MLCELLKTGVSTVVQARGRFGLGSANWNFGEPSSAKRSVGSRPCLEGRKEITIVVDGHGDLSLRVNEKNSQVLSSPPDVLRRPPALSSSGRTSITDKADLYSLSGPARQRLPVQCQRSPSLRDSAPGHAAAPPAGHRHGQRPGLTT
jgi:hypothetical protein